MKGYCDFGIVTEHSLAEDIVIEDNITENTPNENNLT